MSELTITEAKELTYSIEKVMPIPYLKIINGYLCEYNGCTIVCGNLDMIKKHCRVEHESMAKNGVHWSKTGAQTFYQGNDRRYVS